MSKVKTIIYMDYAAATPLDTSVQKSMQPYFSMQFYNPSATYLAARSIHKDIEAARARVAGLLGARPSEIIFTAGGTEANNLAIHGVMGKYPKANMVVSAIEHDSVLYPAGVYAHKIAPVMSDGVIDIQKLAKTIDNDTVLVSIMLANNEIGTIQPIRKVAALLAGIKKQRLADNNPLPLYLHTDACQAAAYLDIHVHRLAADLMTINGGKIYGPKQSGVLFVKTGVELTPQILGGGQERGLRSGTENVAGIIGLAAALSLVRERRETETARMANLQKLFYEFLEDKTPEVVINGSRKARLPNNVHITIPGHDNERLMMELDERGVQCAAGSACSASSEEPSHVLKAIGMSDTDAQASLRFTLGQGTTEADVKTATAQLLACL
jgi:cysteine desulfurase